MKSSIIRASAALFALVAVVACSDDDGPLRPPDAMPVDVAVADASPPADAGVGDTGPAEGGLVSVGAVPQAAFDTFRCGVTGAWLDDARLGDLVTTGDAPPVVQKAQFLAALIEASGYEVNQEPTHDVESDTILYLTQDRGALIEASTLVAYPVGVEGQEFPTLLFLHGTTGFKDGCGPSAVAEVSLLLAYFASLGYLVVAPDYIGLKGFGEPTGFLHPYLVAEATVIASLDSVRAVRKLVRQRHPQTLSSPRVVTLGGSQGGHAALWVDWLGPYYAQELELIGGVATVPPADVLRQVERALAEEVEATDNTVAFYGAASAWYGVDSRLHEVFLPRDPSVQQLLSSQCIPDDALAGETPQSLFSSQILSAARNNALADYDIWGCMAVQNSLNRTAVPRITPSSDSYGILYVVGEADTLVHPTFQRESFDALCAQGVPLSYLECAGASHTKATAWALPEILDYLADRVAGRPVEDICQRSAATRCQGTSE